jgi:fatty acid desaturase
VVAFFICKERKGDSMKRWLADTAIKVVRTMAQTAVGVISGSAVFTEVDWLMVASATGIAGVTCLLMNIGNIKTITESEGVK